MNLLRPTFFALAALLIAAPTLAAAQAPEAGPVLRGAQRYKRAAPPPVKAPPPPAPPIRSDFPGLPDTTPRLGGLTAEARGGAACRTSCASTYYFCLRGDTSTACGARWARCVSACPDISGRP